MDIYLCGMMSALYWVAATIFLRFWKQTRDRFFLFFFTAFLIFGFSRLPRAFQETESSLTIYAVIIRLLGYLCILVAIVDKNSRKS